MLTTEVAIDIFVKIVPIILFLFLQRDWPLLSMNIDIDILPYSSPAFFISHCLCYMCLGYTHLAPIQSLCASVYTLFLLVNIVTFFSGWSLGGGRKIIQYIFISYSVDFSRFTPLVTVCFCHHNARAAASDITVTSTRNWSIGYACFSPHCEGERISLLDSNYLSYINEWILTSFSLVKTVLLLHNYTLVTQYEDILCLIFQWACQYDGICFDFIRN